LTNLFTRNLGKTFLDTVPQCPGIYQVYDDQQRLIYVGKSKNLRRRLSQYKNSKRRKKHRKMRKIVEQASKVEFQICPTELEAELLETQLIQLHRPKWNTAGAFFFLYPMIGIKCVEHSMYLCYTTQPDQFDGFSFHGAFRSRDITGEAFFALVKLLRYVAHPEPKKKRGSVVLPKYSYVYGYRQPPGVSSEAWRDQWEAFLKGESQDALETLVLALIEHAGARRKTEEVQEYLNHLSRFWKHEASLLYQARSHVEYPLYPVSQKERDHVFLKFRYARRLEKHPNQK
jgi:excinuclease ABC subunit C